MLIPSSSVAARLILILPLLLVLALTSCGDSAETGVQVTPSTPTSSPLRTSTEEIRERRVIGEGYESAPWSLEGLVQSYDVVIVGTVSDVLLPFDPRPNPDFFDDFEAAHPSNEPRPAGHPKAGPQPTPSEYGQGRGFTIYTVTVERVVRLTAATLGSTVSLFHSGGVFRGVAYEEERDPVIEVGSTYLFFLTTNANRFAELLGPSSGRFLVDGSGRLQPVETAFADLPSVAALTGLTLDEAEAAILAAALAPIPLPPTSELLSYWPVPEPTP